MRDLTRAAVAALLLAACAPAPRPPAPADRADQTEAAIAEIESILEAPSSTLRANPALIQQMVTVAEACWGSGTMTELGEVWFNPDTPGPALDAVACACRYVRPELDAVLLYRGWTALPPPCQFVSRIDFADLAWMGAAACPDVRQDGNWVFRNLAEADIAKIPGRDSVIVQANKWLVTLQLPQLVRSKNVNQLNDCSINEIVHAKATIQPRTSIGTNYELGAVTLLGQDLWTASFEFYNTAARDHDGMVVLRNVVSLGLSSLNAQGAWRAARDGWNWSCADVPNVSCQGWINPGDLEIGHYNKTTGDQLSTIDAAFRPRLGGRELIGGRYRGAGAFGGAQGPIAYAFFSTPRPDGSLGGVPLLCYPTGSHTWPGYKKAETSYEAEWIHDPTTGRRALLVVGTRGLGTDYYGPGPPGTPAKGWHADPYDAWWGLYDVEDLVAVYEDRMQPWEPMPYAEGRPDWPFQLPAEGFRDDVRQAFAKGMCWDEATRRLYVIQKRIDPTPDQFGNGDDKRRVIVNVLELR